MFVSLHATKMQPLTQIPFMANCVLWRIYWSFRFAGGQGIFCSAWIFSCTVLGILPYRMMTEPFVILPDVASGFAVVAKARSIFVRHNGGFTSSMICTQSETIC